MTPLHVNARLWDEDSGSIGPVILTIERTDEDEISLAIIDQSESDPENLEVARCWITRDAATRLAALLGVAVLANELAGHEAAKLEQRET